MNEKITKEKVVLQWKMGKTANKLYVFFEKENVLNMNGKLAI